MGKIFITSDLHFGHNKSFLYEPRGFSTIEEHDQEIIKRWNSVIELEDEVYILGDLMLNDNDYGMECLQQLRGKLHIVVGNHDTARRVELYASIPAVQEVKDIIHLKYRGYLFYCSHYPTITSNNDIDKPLKARVLNLCGHSHTQERWSDADKGYIYHVELDAHNCYPIALDDIIAEFREQYINNIEVPKPYNAYLEREKYYQERCNKCIHFRINCGGPSLVAPQTCPPAYNYKRDPPDGGYYG